MRPVEVDDAAAEDGDGEGDARAEGAVDEEDARVQDAQGLDQAAGEPPVAVRKLDGARQVPGVKSEVSCWQGLDPVCLPRHLQFDFRFSPLQRIIVGQLVAKVRPEATADHKLII